jgi:hypothetical protein
MLCDSHDSPDSPYFGLLIFFFFILEKIFLKKWRIRRIIFSLPYLWFIEINDVRNKGFATS